MASEIPVLPPRPMPPSMDSNREEASSGGAPPPLPLRKAPTLPAIAPDVLAPLETNEVFLTAGLPAPDTIPVTGVRNDASFGATSNGVAPTLPIRNATVSLPLRTPTVQTTPVNAHAQPVTESSSSIQGGVTVQTSSSGQNYTTPTRLLSYVLREPVEQTHGRMLMLAPIPKAFNYISKLPPSPAPLTSIIDSSLLGAQLMLHDKQTRRKALAPTVLALACAATVMACIPSPRWMSWLRYMLLLTSMYLGPRHIIGLYPIGGLAVVGAVFNIEAVMICICILYSSSILLTRHLEKRDGWNPNAPAPRGFGNVRIQEGWRPVALDVVQNTSDWWRWRSSDEERTRRRQKKEVALEQKELKRVEQERNKKEKDAAAEIKRTMDESLAKEKLAKDQEARDAKRKLDETSANEKLAKDQEAREVKRKLDETKAEEKLAKDQEAREAKQKIIETKAEEKLAKEREAREVKRKLDEIKAAEKLAKEQQALEIKQKAHEKKAQEKLAQEQKAREIQQKMDEKKAEAKLAKEQQALEIKQKAHEKKAQEKLAQEQKAREIQQKLDEKKAEAKLAKDLEAQRVKDAKIAKDQEAQRVKDAKLAAAEIAKEEKKKQAEAKAQMAAEAAETAKEEKERQAEAKAQLAAEEKAEKQRAKQETEDAKLREKAEALEQKRNEADAAQAANLDNQKLPEVPDALQDAPRDEIVSAPSVSGEELRLAMESERMRQEQRRLEGKTP